MELNNNFLSELFKGIIKDKKVFDVSLMHMQYHHLPSEYWKEIWKFIIEFNKKHKTSPSFGILYQNFSGNEKITNVLEGIEEAEIVDHKLLLSQFETFLKDLISIEFNEKFVDFYSKGEKNKARNLLWETADKLNTLYVNQNHNFEKIFGGFSNRLGVNKINTMMEGEDKKIFFGMDELDMKTGGLDPGDTACFLARSGVGKSKCLRHIGVYNARKGLTGIHIQLEGTKKKCLAGYDATWTAQSALNLEKGDVDDVVYEKLKTISQSVYNTGGEVYVYGIEQFEKPTLVEIRNIILSFVKEFGKSPNFVLIDYLELLNPGNGIPYQVSQERFRRLAIAEGMKNIAVEFKSALITATQANDIPMNLWNDPEYVLTRHNVSEAKSLPNPFSFFFTLNQTTEEYEEGTMRLFADKVRDSKGWWISEIRQAYDFDKFYDRKRTLREVLGV